MPDDSDRFTISIIAGSKIVIHSFSKLVGIGSSSQVEFLADLITVWISSNVARANSDNVPQEGCLNVSVAKLWEFFSISVLILLILFMKYVLNSSANCKAEV